MDVRCEKCQTEYELDEARLKPGGVTVKCTNCGHMFKIRKRSTTNVGAPPPEPPRNRPVSSKPPSVAAAPAPQTLVSDEAPTTRKPDLLGDDPKGTDTRQWLVRLENGEQKSCRELAALQQWIVSGIVTRESLISRSGKTWKRLGDIAELSQYFTIADEARAKRASKPTPRPVAQHPHQAQQATMLGVGGATAAGGTILPDDDDTEGRSTGSYAARGNTTPPPLPRASRPITQPPPPPAKRGSNTSSGPSMGGDMAVPAGSRATASWASTDISASASMSSMPAGPAGGRLKVSNDEPAFAGRVRVSPTDENSFGTGQVRNLDGDDDDEMMRQQRGGKGGLLLVVMALLVIGAAAGAIYVFMIKKDKPIETATQPAVAADAAVVATADAAALPPTVDASVAPVSTPVDLARAALGVDHERELRDALKSLDGNGDPAADTVRAHLVAAIAQGMLDRALLGDKADAEKLKKDAKSLVLDASTPAQKAIKATPDDPGANLAMAAVLRLQGKPLKDVQRYLETAKAKVTPDWKRDVALGEALALARDAKLEDAKALLAPLDQGDDKLETSGDVRVRFRLAMIAYQQNKNADAKALVDTILAAQPDHAGAKALAARLANTVAKTDPLPPEETPNPGTTKPPTEKPNVEPSGGAEGYDKLLSRANALAESNCTKALEVYAKALEQKPNGVEALTGMGYCHIDAKQYASAFSKFRAALAVSSRFEPALWGIAEAYMQQGRKEQAIEAINKYLDAFPGNAKAQKALDRMGGSTPPPTTPDPTPTPTPTPAPATDGTTTPAP